MGVSEQPIGFAIFVPELNEEVPTVHCVIDENIPHRNDEYFKEIDDMFNVTESESRRKPEDFNYLVGLLHRDDEDGMIYKTTRIGVRRNNIVAYRKLHSPSDVVLEEKEPIHVQDIANMTAAYMSNSVFARNGNAPDLLELGQSSKMCGSESLETLPNIRLKKSVAARGSSGAATSEVGDASLSSKTKKRKTKSSTDEKLKEKFRRNAKSRRELLNVGKLGDISMLLSDGNIVEPNNLSEAKKLPERTFWIRGTRREIKKLRERKCWKIALIPKHRRLVKSKFVFRVKRDFAGRVKKFKVRLVARGFTQRQGVDFSETFSPVAKGVTFRLAMALAIKNNMLKHQIDVETAFPYADLEEEVYMSPPPGAYLPPGYCLKLQKSLYGLKQAPRNWHSLVQSTVKGLGYQQSKLDTCLFYKRDAAGELHVVVLYVDDIIILTGDEGEKDGVIAGFRQQYAVQDLGSLKHYLGIVVDDCPEHVVVHQRQYTVDILERFAHLLPESCRLQKDGKPRRLVKTPLPSGCKLSKHDKERETKAQSDYADNFPYQQVIGAVMYLAVNTRPGLSYAVNTLSRFNKQPTYAACKAVVHLLCYIASSVGRGLKFPKNDSSGLAAYSDADWAGDHDTSRSTTGYVVYLWGAPIAWQARLQPTVATSSMESEYMAAYAAIQEILWVRGVLSELGYNEYDLDSSQPPTSLFMDSKSAINLAENPVHHKRSKHIRVKYHWIREQVGAKVVKLVHVPTADMVADIFTKGLGEKLNTKHLNAMTVML